MTYFEVSEAVSKGHPDKIADQISDAVLDACLREDPFSRAAVETLISHDIVVVAGEVTTLAKLDIAKIVNSVIGSIGYDNLAFGDFLSAHQVFSSLCDQSYDISQSVGEQRSLISKLAAGDQGMMYGYACQDTPSLMPRSYEIARSIVREIEIFREENDALGPDGKTQISIDTKNPSNGSLVLSWQHRDDIMIEEVRSILMTPIQKVLDLYKFQPEKILINPSGRFVLGGPFADTGLTGRKQIFDSYGGSIPHGGGAYSGKDGTKVDRSGAYMARWVAKHVVAAQLASRCLIQLVYSIGIKDPIHVGVECFHTETVPLEILQKAIKKTFDFSVGAIIQDLKLTSPFFQATAHGGHFGRQEFTWEELSRINTLSLAIK
jgi:S-adenosylmethionine synthetase